MANIYNKITKKRRNGVKWAKGGKYWYKTGSKARYYPKNGWTSSSYGNSSYRSNYKRRSYRRY